MTNTLVQATHIKKHFGSTHAVDDVSLQIKAGEIYGLVGADGAGKTTTIRLLVGALRPDQGEITVCGYDVIRKTELARQQLGYLSQRFSMYEDLTVLENIRFFRRKYVVSNRMNGCRVLLKFWILSGWKNSRTAAPANFLAA